jgi:hypothetical protein
MITSVLWQAYTYLVEAIRSHEIEKLFQFNFSFFKTTFDGNYDIRASLSSTFCKAVRAAIVSPVK